MTAHRNDATLESDAHRHTAARPDRGQAEDGKSGGTLHRGEPGASQFGGDGGEGADAQSGTGSERYAPGVSTDKKADDTK